MAGPSQGASFASDSGKQETGDPRSDKRAAVCVTHNLSQLWSHLEEPAQFWPSTYSGIQWTSYTVLAEEPRRKARRQGERGTVLKISCADLPLLVYMSAVSLWQIP